MRAPVGGCLPQVRLAVRRGARDGEDGRVRLAAGSGARLAGRFARACSPPSCTSRWWNLHRWTRLPRLCRAAVRPVLDVVRVQEATLRAARGSGSSGRGSGAPRRAPAARSGSRRPTDSGQPVALEDPNQTRRRRPACARVSGWSGAPSSSSQAPSSRCRGAVRRAERGGVDVNDDLVTVRRRGVCAGAGRQQRLRHRVRAPLAFETERAVARRPRLALRRRFRLLASDCAAPRTRRVRVRARPLASSRRLSRAASSAARNERALLGGQTPAHDQRAVLVVLADQVGIAVSALVRRQLPLDHPVVRAQHPLQLGGGRVTGELRAGRAPASESRHPRERAHLRVAQLTPPERGVDERQLGERG